MRCQTLTLPWHTLKPAPRASLAWNASGARCLNYEAKAFDLNPLLRSLPPEVSESQRM